MITLAHLCLVKNDEESTQDYSLGGKMMWVEDEITKYERKRGNVLSPSHFDGIELSISNIIHIHFVHQKKDEGAAASWK